jgi:hypothetical protein
MAKSDGDTKKPTGIGVDASGGSVIDPTANVVALVKAEAARLDALRKAAVLRIDDLRKAESRRVDEVATLRADYEEKLRSAEAKRIDAIRAVDVNAVSVAAQRSSDQASVLANQVSQSAEALRTLVSTTAATVAAAQQQLGNQLSARITTLEQTQYEGKGRQSFADPQMVQLISEVKALNSQRQGDSGRTVGRNEVIAWIVAASAAVFGLLHYLK